MIVNCGYLAKSLILISPVSTSVCRNCKRFSDATTKHLFPPPYSTRPARVVTCATNFWRHMRYTFVQIALCGPTNTTLVILPKQFHSQQSGNATARFSQILKSSCLPKKQKIEQLPDNSYASVKSVAVSCPWGSQICNYTSPRTPHYRNNNASIMVMDPFWISVLSVAAALSVMRAWRHRACVCHLDPGWLGWQSSAAQSQSIDREIMSMMNWWIRSLSYCGELVRIETSPGVSGDRRLRWCLELSCWSELRVEGLVEGVTESLARQFT